MGFMSRVATCAALVAAWPSAGAQPRGKLELERRDGPLPALGWDTPVFCEGAYRFQCDEGTKTCLVATSRELDAEGKPAEELARIQSYCQEDSLEARAARGFHFVQAVAEAPPGWIRDERGRVMQFNFDMHRRIWLGGGFAPGGLQGPGWRRSGEAEFGTRVDLGDDEGQTLVRLHLLEGRLDPGLSQANVTVFSLDWSHVYSNAPIRLTTFVGKPRRFDLHLDVGLYLLAGRFEVFELPTPQRWTTIAAAEPTLDLWRSRELDSYLRLRAGPALEQDPTANTRFAVEGGLDFEGILDRDGFHRLYASADLAEIWGARDAPFRRAEGRAGYELILLAVNDQPISAVLEARGAWRDDLAGITPGWDLGAYAGLRFSFWAPARRSAPRPAEAR